MTDIELLQLSNEITASVQAASSKLRQAVERIDAMDRREAELLATINQVRDAQRLAWLKDKETPS